jgi:hypothetical protein
MENTVEISVRGKWVKVSAIDINGRAVVVAGKWIKVATIQDEYWLEGELEDPEAFIRSLKEHRSKGFKADIFAFTQKLPNVRPRHAYPMEWDNVAAICLSSFEEWWKRLPTETRRNVRLSTKRGVVTQVTELNKDFIRGIVEINNESPFRQGRRFHHYGKDVDTVRKDYSTFLERSEFIGAYDGGELIGFMKIVYIGEVAAIMQILSKTSHYHKKPANALIAKAVEHCQKKNLSFLTYMKYRYGNKRENPLTEFKRRNGFEEFPVPRYYVPLTAKGKICMALKLHRDLVGILPEALIYPLLSLRRMWYKLAFSRKPM